ncbi:hypothetical protein [Colwellia psychrerythraea]|nr:hypothetical protein [Colwellia psychrerythraea]
MIIKLLELHLYLLGGFVICLFYLQIVVTPIIFVGLLGTVSLNYLEYSSSLIIITGCIFIGLVLGLFWAERIRKTLGIVTFHAYLLSTPEIDGWRDGKGNRISES